MQYKDHIVYIDLTTRCGIGCDFCMYNSFTSKGEDLTLSFKGSKQLREIINHKSVEKIVLSGEGEPFMSADKVFDILNLSDGCKRFQIVTNGFWTKNIDLLDKLKSKITQNGDKLDIRISIDSFHRKALGDELYKNVIEVSRKYSSLNMSFSFRSLLEERDEIISFLNDITGVRSIQCSLIDDILCLKDNDINISYKNIVNPPKGYKAIEMRSYIEMLSKKYKKPFTFGNITTSRAINGLDITVKPDGSVLFYGALNKSIGNINYDEITIDVLINILRTTPLLKSLYTIPFLDILEKLTNSEIEQLIAEINNPYWFIKSLPKKYLTQVEKLFSC